uniref:X8 domain-containing protein n=1 Tax=Arundo donax TaxID=35708 RepID=A0A0A9HC04_ARUDO
MKLACSMADCTTLYYGGSCYGIGQKGNVSYAFNSYYQQQKQDPKSCDFDGLGMITYLDPSMGDCRFVVSVDDSKSSTVASCGGPCCTVFCGMCVLVFWVSMYLRMMVSA